MIQCLLDSVVCATCYLCSLGDLVGCHLVRNVDACLLFWHSTYSHSCTFLSPVTSAWLLQGVEEYEPQVIDMIIDFVFSYTTDVLIDAQAFGDAAGLQSGNINLQDVELAIHSRMDMSFAQTPSLEVRSCAATRNEAKLHVDCCNSFVVQ
jgi:Transcription initiation factor IID, 31kD subunit